MVINLSHYHNLIMMLVFNFHVQHALEHASNPELICRTHKFHPMSSIQYVIKKHFICFDCCQRVRKKMTEFSHAIYISNCKMVNISVAWSMLLFGSFFGHHTIAPKAEHTYLCVCVLSENQHSIMAFQLIKAWTFQKVFLWKVIQSV